MTQIGGDRDILQYELPHRVRFSRYMTQLFGDGDILQWEFPCQVRWLRCVAQFSL